MSGIIRARLRFLIVGAATAAIAVAVGLYLMTEAGRKPPARAQMGAAAGVTRDLAKGALAAFVVKPQRLPVPEIDFNDASGAPLRLSQWKGRVVLVNLWATWCAPCRKEMPDLAKLQHKLGGADFEVVAISVDRKGAAASGAFLAETGATALKLYVDVSAASLDKLQAIGLPASVLVDRQGNEIGRLLGPADWSSPDAVALIEAAIAEGRKG